MIRKRTYSELVSLKTFEERYEYLKLQGVVGESTFGSLKYMTTLVYNTPRWKSLRNKIIVRDLGCDLGIEERPIFGSVYVHHINPITMDDILADDQCVYNPEFLISVEFNTHNAIHYSNANILKKDYVERTFGDTNLWSRKNSN